MSDGAARRGVSPATTDDKMAEGPTDSDPIPPREGDASATGPRRGLLSAEDALQPDMVPPPPLGSRRRRPVVATVSGVLSFLGIAAVAFVVLGSLAIQRIAAPGPLPADKVVVIAPHSQVGDIASQLEAANVVDSGALMTGVVYLEGDRDRLKAGEYRFKQNASLRDVIDLLVSGRQILHAITIPEGLTSEQICDRLRADDVLTGDIGTVPKEGTLMPDTFKFARGTTRDQMLHTMAQEQRRVVAEVWSHRAADIPLKSPYEMLTLASIVEKETGRADERPRVAGVFVNRLLKGIPLQSDPTIVYGLVGGKATLGRGILRSEIEQKTPYNTYAIAGLPPGPICNPGRAAMDAVANPSRTKDLYFVADGTGGHAFAETLDQHRQNVQRWRQLEKDAKDKVAPELDKGAAPAAPPASTRQRGDAAPSVPIYGALPEPFGGVRAGSAPAALMVGIATPPVELGDTDAAARFSAPTPDQTASLDPDGPGDMPTDSASFFGVASAPSPAPVGPDPGLSFPVSAAQRADEKARAARFAGVAPGPDAPVPAAEVASAEQGAPPMVGRPGHGAVTDASEGTALDPLRDKTYDLMTAKTVPAELGSAFAPKPPGMPVAARASGRPSRKVRRVAARAPAPPAPAPATP